LRARRYPAFARDRERIDMTSRRQILQLLAAASIAEATSALAQETRKIRRVGFIAPSTGAEQRVALFRQGLRELGYVEGKNIQIDFRTGENAEVLNDAAADLVRQKVDILVTVVSAGAEAARLATREIPIVLAPIGDAVAQGFVTSLSKPGGNITGISINAAEAAGKCLEILREVMPHARRVAGLADITESFSKLFVEQLQRTAKQLRMDFHPIMVNGVPDVNAGLQALAKLKPHMAIVQAPLGVKTAERVMKQGIATASPSNVLAPACLVTYSADIQDMYRLAADYVDRILKGAKPAELPVRQPTRFELIANLKAAQTLGITIPQSVLLRSTRVIE
jgi:putative ABC transport system substrate-binding protein